MTPLRPIRRRLSTLLVNFKCTPDERASVIGCAIGEGNLADHHNDWPRCKHHQTARRWFEITLPPLSWELAELSFNSQGTHRLIQPLPSPIYTHIRRRHSQIATHCSLDRSHIYQLISAMVALHNGLSQATLRADSRPLSKPTQGYAGSCSQPLRTCQLIGSRHTKTTTLRLKTPAVATDAPAHSRAMLPGICNATDSGEHSVRLTTLAITCCLMARASYCLNQCWHIIGKVPWPMTLIWGHYLKKIWYQSEYIKNRLQTDLPGNNELS